MKLHKKYEQETGEIKPISLFEYHKWYKEYEKWLEVYVMNELIQQIKSTNTEKK